MIQIAIMTNLSIMKFRLLEDEEISEIEETSHAQLDKFSAFIYSVVRL